MKRRRLLPIVALLTVLGGAAHQAEAVMSGAESPLVSSGDADYAAGKTAFLGEDWDAAIAHLLKVVERRPWHDNAHAMLGYAYRRQERWDPSFHHYAKALEHNPRHRGALEYLAEAYLQLGREEEARVMAERLGNVCRFVVMAFDNQGWKTGCEEFDTLRNEFIARGIEVAPVDRSRER